MYKNHFLRTVAEDILRETRSQLQNTVIIMPSKRSCLFLEHYLAELRNEKAFFAPVVLTVEQWISRVSGLTIPDSTSLACYAYKAYRSFLTTLTEEEQNDAFNDPILVFDRAQKLLNDYDEIDHHLLDVDTIFTNIQYWNEYASLSFLTENQKEAIKDFWGKLPERLTIEEMASDGNDSATTIQKYISVVEAAQKIYLLLQEIWEEEQCGYKGWVYRKTSQLTPEELVHRTMSAYGLTHIDHFYCVGLYNLTPVERLIFKNAKQILPHFYAFWEEVTLPLNGVAGGKLAQHSIDANIQYLGGERVRVSESLPKVELLRASSSVIQERIVEDLVDTILEDDPKAIEELRIAVVLSDEKTLIPLLDMASSQEYAVNITMGYPLKNTSIAIWIKRYLEVIDAIQKSPTADRGGDKFVVVKLKRWIQAPLTQKLLGVNSKTYSNKLANASIVVQRSELCEMFDSLTTEPSLMVDNLFPATVSGVGFIGQVKRLIEMVEELNAQRIARLKEEGNDSLISSYMLENEYIYRYRTILNKLQNTLGRLSDFDDIRIMSNLLACLVDRDQIPFEGEPLMGLQVMGFLETRALSFDHVIMLDVKEGQLPKVVRYNSLIPYSLRLAYQLPSHKTRDEINAYHFYRLIGSAQKATLLRDVREKNLGGNTPSRYLKQIELLSTIDYVERDIAMPLPAVRTSPIEIAPDDSLLQEFRDKLRRAATAEEPELRLSASDIKKYFRCPLSFYWAKIKGIEEPKIKQEMLPPDEAGNIVHGTLEVLLKPWKEKQIPLGRTPIDNQVIEKILEEKYCEVRWGKMKKLYPVDKLNIQNLKKMVLVALRNDYALINKGYTIYYEEFEKKIELSFVTPNENIFPFKGFIDRVDRIISPNGKQTWRIVDYKTGAMEELDLPSCNFKEILQKNSKQLPILEIAIQLALYSAAFLQNNPKTFSTLPVIYALNPKNSKKTSLELIYEDEPILFYKQGIYSENQFGADLINEVLGIFDELLDDSMPIRQTPYTDSCSFCPYAEICGRTE